MVSNVLELNLDKISVIIPIYNVQCFLRRCIESVINQTYQNLEIILVDDGSIDNCPFICDEYACLDNRIKVIHKKHGGVSDARNVGIESSSGDYIGFVDSDDWIENDMYEILHAKAVSLNTDITICGYHIVQKNKQHFSYFIKEDTVVSGTEGSEILLNDTMIKNYPWNKLYKKELFNHIRYPVGMNYEDIATTFKLFALSKRIAIIPDYLYYYILRDEGISQQKTFHNLYDLYKAYEYRLNDLVKILPEYKLFMFELTVSTSLLVYNLSLKEKLSIADQEKIPILISSLKEYSKMPEVKALKKLDRIRLNIITKFKILYKLLYFIYTVLSPKIAKHPSLRCRLLSLFGYLNYNKKYQRDIIQKKAIYLFGTPEHNNIGDHAIAIATKKYLKNILPDHKIIEIPENKLLIYLPGIKKNIKKNDYIVYSGGGNIGNQYQYIENIRRVVIKAFPKNKIMLFPQTIFFTDDYSGRKAFKQSKRIYSKHPNLIIVAREQYSHKILKKYFTNNKILIAPDMAMYIEQTKEGKCVREGAVICLRNDSESILKSKDRNYIKECLDKYYHKVTETDTCSYRNIINENERVLELKAKLFQFKQAEMVVTDRLHGMIFSAFTGTPCIVINNYNYKICGTYHWLRHLNYIKFLNDLSNIEKSIDQLIALDDNIEYNNEFTKQYYAKMTEELTKR